MPLTPKNRKEQWLEGLIQHETTLTPKNRPEAWMKEIIDASGGGGTGGGVLFVELDFSGGDAPALNKTWKEIYDARTTSLVICDVGQDQFLPYYLAATYIVPNANYEVVFMGLAAYDTPTLKTFRFRTTTENGYPVFVS